MTVDHLDARHGGTWRFVHRDGDGSEYGFHGVFHGTPSLEAGIVQTWEFEGAPGHVKLGTITFEERGGRTLVHLNSVHQSVEARDAEVQSGMAEASGRASITSTSSSPGSPPRADTRGGRRVAGSGTGLTSP